MTEIKRCPFCGCKVYPVYTSREERFYFAHYAEGRKKCEIEEFTIKRGAKSLAEAMEAWNRRAKQTDTRSEQERWLNGE
jgi:hypothetical protein